MSRHLAPFVCVVLTAPVVAQADVTELPRSRVFGEARLADRGAWAGATVHLLARPVPGDERIGKPDLLRVVTNERGQFHASVLTGRPYTVWATEATEGGLRISAAAEDVFPTVPVQLHEAGGPRRSRRFEIRAAAWQERGPLSFHLVSDTINVLSQHVTPDADGAITLPEWPGQSVELEVFDAAGVPVHTRSLALSGDDDVIELPAPRQLGCVVTSIDNKAGVAGARVCLRHRDQLHELGVTGEDGRLVLRSGLPERASLFVVPPEDSELGVGLMRAVGRGHEPEAPPELRPGVAADYHVNLGTGSTVRGRILLQTGAPAADLPLLVLGPAIHRWERGSSLDEVSRLVRTDADGRFRVHGCCGDATLLAVLSDRQIAALPEDWRDGLHPTVYLPGTELGEAVSLALLRPVDLRVQMPDGVPADRPRLSFVNLACREHLASTTYRVSADRAGRLRLLMPAAESIAVSIRHGDSWLMRSLRIDAAPGTPAKLPIALPEPCHVRGVLTSVAAGPRQRKLLCYPDPRQPRTGPLGPQLDPVPEAVGAHLTRLPSPSDTLRTFHAVAGLDYVSTDENGAFDVVVPSVWLPYYILAREDGMKAELRFALEGKTVEGLEVVLR